MGSGSWGKSESQSNISNIRMLILTQWDERKVFPPYCFGLLNPKLVTKGAVI
jgi:hypothetical protein